MKHPRFRRTVAAAFLPVLILTASGRQADFNEVGDYMSRMLQNNHFERPPFMELGQRFLDDYLADLDPGKVYFNQADIDRFNRDYAKQLPDMLLKDSSMKAANDIYDTFKKRVETRVAEAKKLLSEDSAFDFSKGESILRTRKDAAWPKDEAEATSIWRQQIKEALLSETLRRDMVAKLAQEQGKPNPLEKEKSPKEKITLRYERFLRSVTQDVDADDVAALFLSAVAQAFDPHTDYMSSREMERFTDQMRNQLVGIGAQLQGEEDGATKIMGIVVGGPADKQGQLKLNDRVVAVDPDGEKGPQEMTDVMFMRLDKVVDLIRGDEGTNVTLKVEPAGGAPGETKLIGIARDKVELKDELASAEIIQVKNDAGVVTKLGIITLPSFYVDFEKQKTGCAADVENLLKRLKKEKIDGLMLDLRRNGGGSLQEVQRMAGLFIGSSPVVQVKNQLGQTQVLESDLEEAIYDGPMVVLTDKGSASASEILAGALQDSNRAVIVGESSTFGKGTVQMPLEIAKAMPFFSARDQAGTLKMTIQKFYRPSGSSTQNQGVIPDIVLPSLVDALEVGETYLNHSLKHDDIRQAPDFKPLDRSKLAVPRLKELSDARVKDSKDFSYIVEDVAKAKDRLRDNKVSLNLDERKKELGDIDKQQHERNAERKDRFASIESKDKGHLTFYALPLEDVDKTTPLEPVDPSKEAHKNMISAKDETQELDTTPKWPSGLDPYKREGMMVLEDMVTIRRDPRMADVTQKPDVR